MADVHSLLARLPPPDHAAAARVRERSAGVLRPQAALRRLDDVAVWLASWQRTESPRVEAPAALVFVGDHGVAVHGVSAYPSAVTAEVKRALEAGAATANAMASAVGAHLRVVDVGVGRPTGDLMSEPALSPARFDECFAAGRDAVAGLECDLLVPGEMGIANTTAAAAVCAALYGGDARDWTGRGTGVDDTAYHRKVKVVASAVRRVAAVRDPIEVLREVGGAELVAIAGAVVEARLRSLPVLLDGYVVGAAVAPLAVARDDALDHCLAAHRSAERGHALLLNRLGLQPLLDLELRLGEGSGALLAVPVLKLAAVCVTGVATFEEWGLER